MGNSATMRRMGDLEGWIFRGGPISLISSIRNERLNIEERESFFDWTVLVARLFCRIVLTVCLYTIPVSVVLIRNWTGDLHNKLELTIFLVSLNVMSASIFMRSKVEGNFGEDGYRDRDLSRVLIVVMISLSILLFLPWTYFYPPSYAEFIHLDNDSMIVLVVFSILQSLNILDVELTRTTVHISRELDHVSKIISKTNPEWLSDTELLYSPDEIANAARIVFDEEIRSGVIASVKSCNGLKSLSRFLRLQAHFYFIDMTTSVTGMLYLLYNRLPFSLVTILLTTMSVLPSAASIFNMVYFNSLVRAIEDNNVIVTDLKIGFGFRKFFGREKVCGFDVKDMFYYVADWRLFTIIIGQAVLFIFKNFEAKIFA